MSILNWVSCFRRSGISGGREQGRQPGQTIIHYFRWESRWESRGERRSSVAELAAGWLLAGVGLLARG